jgi:hypothetical protein
MQQQRKPRVDPRLAFALALLAIPFLYLVAQVILVRAGEDCGEADHSQVGAITQLFVPGSGCEPQPSGSGSGSGPG